MLSEMLQRSIKYSVLPFKLAGHLKVARIHVRRILLVPLPHKSYDSPRRVFSGNRPRLIGATVDGGFRLQAAESEIHGKTSEFEQNDENVVIRSGETDRVVWTLDVADSETGMYLAFLHYACDDRSAGNTCHIDISDARLTSRILGTGAWDSYKKILLGRIELKTGIRRLTLQVSGNNSSSCLLDLRELQLVPVPILSLPGTEAE